MSPAATWMAAGAVSVGASTGNLRFDYVAFSGDPSPVRANTWGQLRAIYR